ncbi:hypothetical protein [Jeotgalicoccus sp. WY2]|uniref:hypothetical protein n=1 Tax=Jeotgalicoccus sp. WY2 TaxID=2708346 RepID=UPI001BD58DFB|nr:hypothetical protein [Jeotgalicoccus sp. WY2]
MKKLKYLDVSNTFIHEDKYIPFYRDASVYEHESGGLLECMQLSFLDAIISSEFSKYHPQLLILDSISKYFGTNKYHDDVATHTLIEDPEVYLNIYYMLIDLSKKAQISSREYPTKRSRNVC